MKLNHRFFDKGFRRACSLSLCAFMGVSFFGLQGIASSAVGRKQCSPQSPLKWVSNYSLVDAMTQGRSRRFFKGAEMPANDLLGYKSQRAPERLSEEEEALMVFAGAGITGYVAADLPYQPATAANGNSGNGNVMVQLVGRTFASGDSAQLVSLLVINDDGVWLIKRPQDLSPAETKKVILHGRNKEWVQAYRMLRVKIADKRVEMPLVKQLTATFNMWSVNKPGTTYFLPIIDYSAIYLAVLYQILSPELEGFIVDERNGFAPAGVGNYVKSDPALGIDNPTGWMDANPASHMTTTIQTIESMTSQFAAVELGGMLQNMRLMAQALGLGGFPNYAGTPGVWGGLLGFTQDQVPLYKVMGLSAENPAAKIPSMQAMVPVDVRLERGGKKLLNTFTPFNYNGSGYQTAKAFAEFKFGKTGSLKDLKAPSAWKNPQQVKSAIPVYEERLVVAMGDHIDYVIQRYGRFPSAAGPFGHLSAFQAHVLDPDFYALHYKDGILSDTHKCRSGR